MITQEISLDRLIDDIDKQIEVLLAIAADNAILNEQLRLLNEAREMLLSQELEMKRRAELADPDLDYDHSSMVDRLADEA